MGTARSRLLAAALDLFMRHGVSGTSLQMIADELGVTKAAVYHQFHSKEDIVEAVIAPALAELEAVADAAEAQRRRNDRLRVALEGVVDLVVRHRGLFAMIMTDPQVGRLVRSRPPLRGLEERIEAVLTGPEPDAETLVNSAMVSGALMVAGLDPRLAGLDDETLRRHLTATVFRMLHVRRRATS
ncbi:TetR/AcrR family transcriptional regulator [Actinomadura welshii]|uniref:AcrR family transcriptional regulator n=2 Tax=Actinomadura livida TaxID=79909 RepID=A0A7W7IK30_9ACTN|nr:helix-turn-helix domain-containing protein [Actinomadura catellatispora]MBB4778543.1 AcrR family transcriptional regulator [Actinomadura catellatispora]